jgi:hypothetical protein
MIKIDSEPGWTGAFTRSQADGAIPNGADIVKVRSEDRDAHPTGTPGRVLGSIEHEGVLMYFVEWAPRPRCAVAVVDWKIAQSE